MDMRLVSVIAAGLIISLSASAERSAVCVDKCVTKVITDFKGRPPFKRRIETYSANETSQVEVKEIGELVKVTTVDFRGRPPFKRRTEFLPKVDISEIELSATQENVKPKRRRVGGSSMFKRRR